jgi:RHS repeat-associated protein
LLHEEDYTDNGIGYKSSAVWIANYTIEINAPLDITTISFPDAMCGVPYYTNPLTATGGDEPYTWWNVNSGQLTTYVFNGVSIDPNSGVISGTPTGWNENFPLTIQVIDNQNQSKTKDFKFVVHPQLVINTTYLPNVFYGASYNTIGYTLQASGGVSPYTWSISAGSLPPGLNLDSTTGVLSGVPSAWGTYYFSVQVVDSKSFSTSNPFYITVYPPISITTNSLPDGNVGSNYSQTLQATGGMGGGYCWSISSGSLPTDLTLSTTGAINGTIQTVGTYRFTVLAGSACQNPAATATKQYTIGVYTPLSITTSSLSSGTIGTFYNQALAATGGTGTYTWSITSGGLPDGLNLDTATGVISGIPTDLGIITITVQVADTQNPPATASQTYSFSVTNGTMQNSSELSTVVNCEASKYCTTSSTTDMISGAVIHDQELFRTMGGAFGVAIQLFYKSQPYYNGPLGIGWSHTYDIFLKVNSDGSIILQDGIASKSLYSTSGSSYVSPPGDFSTLVKNGDNTYIITYRDGYKKNFRTDGKIASIVDRFNNTISFGYTGADLTGITDQAQRITTIGYDLIATPHRISTITDPNGKVYDFTYQGSTLYRVTNPAADPAVSQDRGYWEYHYYPNNYLKSKMDPNGNTSQYTYYADHRMQTATDPELRNRTIVYPTTTGNLRTSTLTEKDGGQWLYTYDVQTGVIKSKTDPNGKVTKYTYYPNGFLKSNTEPRDGAIQLTTFYTYDSYGNVLTQTDPVDLSVYSPPYKDPETIADPATLANLSPPVKPAIRYSYDTNNYDRITSISNERVSPFLTTAFVYTTENGGEVVTATATPGNYVTVTKKNPNGTVKQIIDANQKSTAFTYYPDSADNRIAGVVGLLWTVTDPAGVTTTITSYDKNGNPQTVTEKDTAGTVRLTSTQQNDALNRLTQLTKTTAALPNIITMYSHDFMGNINSQIDAETRQTTYEYRYNRQVKKITDAKLNDTVFKYSGSEGNGVDKLIGVYDANVTKNTPLDSQPHTAFSYDKLNRLEYETDQLGKMMHYTYYDNGQIKEKYDATNSTPGTLLATYLYNNRGQVTDKTFTDGTSGHYTFYLDGKLWTAANQNISYTYNYYTDGRLQSVIDTTNSRTISYDLYDALGQRKQVTILKGAGTDERVISYDYDNANRPWHITSNAGNFTFAYDNLGRRDTLSYPNGTIANWDFDDLSRLTAITHKVAGGSSFAAFSYPVYDNVGNRKSVSGNKTETYLYDELYRLLTVTSGKPEVFNFDAVGNRQNGPSPDDTVYVQNAANQMTQGRKLGYGYDDFGNQTTRTVPGATDKSWVQTWDYQNRLVKVEKTKGTEKRTVTFTYDPFGRRIGKQMTTVNDGVTQTQSWSYVYDGDSIAVEIYTDENNTTTKTFYMQGPGIDEHLALERGGLFYYFHADGLGSIAAITDVAHAVVQSYDYDSYGMVTPNSGFRNSYAYTGREWDPESGLYFYRARYHDPMEGRFISKDPVAILGNIYNNDYNISPNQYVNSIINAYAYTDNNPVNFVDPTGLMMDWPKFFKYTDSISGPFIPKYMDRLNAVGDYLVGKALGTIGIATPVFADYLGPALSITGGAIWFNLTSPTKLADPYLGSDGNWYYPGGKPVNASKCNH